MQFDAEAFGRDVGTAICDAVSPLADRIKALESRQPERGAQGPQGEKGRDADPVDVESIVSRVMTLVIERAAFVEAITESVTRSMRERMDTLIAHELPREVRDYLTDNPPPAGPPGERGPQGEKGVGVAGAMQDHEGQLILTLSNGEMTRLGVVVGKDGKDGVDGKDGADFSSVEMDYDGERTIIIRGQGGEIRKRLPIPIDRGYWRDGMSCEKGDVVTHDGSAWIALADTRERPGLAAKECWRMLARKGRDGRPPAAKIDA